ncbi:MAG: transposase [Burkholderia sp.]
MRTSLVRNPFISPEIIDPKFVINMLFDTMTSSRLIYATTPFDADVARCWLVSCALGLHLTKAAKAGSLGGASGSGAGMAERDVPGDCASGKSRKRKNAVGRRNGGLRSDDVRGRSYAPRDQTLEVRVASRRAGLSVMSTVTNRGQVRWKVFEGAMNAGILLDFLKRHDQRYAQQEGVSDVRQPEGSSRQAGQGVVGRAWRQERGVLYLSMPLTPHAQFMQNNAI